MKPEADRLVAATYTGCVLSWSTRMVLHVDAADNR
jgi:hypothetical protein